MLLPSAMCIIVAGGCASRQKSSEADAAWRVDQTLEAHDAVRASALFTAEETQRRYVSIDGDERRMVTIATEPTDRFDAEWARHDGERRTEFLRKAENGNIVMTAAIDHDEHAVSLFDPQLIVAYADLAPGERREQQVSIRVVDEQNPQKQKERGRATQTIEYVGDALIRTEDGELRVQKLTIDFHADLRMADADTITTLYIKPDRGVIVRQREEKVTILGVPGRSSSETLLLREADIEPR